MLLAQYLIVVITEFHVVYQKRFIKGLRQYGKNFFRIRKDFLPSKKTVSACLVCEE